MIYATPGSTFEADSSGAATGLVGTIGVRILHPAAGTTFLARTTAGITEQPAGSGIYFVSLTAPDDAGTYSIVWDDGSAYAPEELVVTYTLPSSVPTGPNLCTLADVRTELELGVTETGRDTKITDLLSRADKAIIKWCGREFLDAGTLTRRFAYYGGGRLNLAPYDLRSATSITIDTDTTSITTLIESTDYYLEPLPADDGVYTHLLLNGFEPADSARDTRREITIVGDWGFPTVPEDVNRAAVITIAGWLDKAVSEYGNNADGDARQLSPGVGAGYHLPSGAKMLLSDYRRRGIA